MINLPHQKPILFVEKLINQNETTLTTLCRFPTIPTLPMIIEASAQSSAFFSEKSRVGFLVMAKDFELLKRLEDKIYKITIDKKMVINNISEFFCQLYERDYLVAKGDFIITIEDFKRS